MNRAEVRNQVVQWSHRSDLVGAVDGFIDNVTSRLNLRLKMDLTLTGNAAENVISIYYPMVYLYGSLRELSIYTADQPATATYEQLYQDEVSRLKITSGNDEITEPSPFIMSEGEVDIAEELLNAT